MRKTTQPTAAEVPAWPVLQYGLLTIIAAFIGVLGLPVFAVHTWAGYRYLNVVAAARRGVAPGIYL